MSRPYTAAAFRDFLQAERNRAANAFQAMEHIQADYQGVYTRFRADHDKTLAALADRVQALSPDALPQELQAAIQARVPDECKAIEKRIADLDKELPRVQKEMDELLAENQQKIAELRRLNPQLNEREERLKADLASVQKQLDDLNRQVSEQASGLGFILHVWKIHEMDRQRYRVLGRVESLSSELHTVRQEWKDKHESAEKEQADSKSGWQKLQVRAGELGQERDELARTSDVLARQRAINFVLDNLKTAVAASGGVNPSGGVHPKDPALDSGLKQMIALNIQTDDFQSALGSIAGILGIMQGMDEGLKRLGESAAAIINEQQRHSAYLSPLNVELDDGVLAFGNVWDELAAKAKDEKAFATHPADFAAATKPFLDERLTNDKIGAYFNALGQALQRATAQWRSS